jgi:hypothetical protein
MSIANFVKAFSPTHIISILAGAGTLIGADLIPFFYGHPISNTAYMIINVVGIVAIAYGNMKVGISASGVEVQK